MSPAAKIISDIIDGKEGMPVSFARVPIHHHPVRLIRIGHCLSVGHEGPDTCKSLILKMLSGRVCLGSFPVMGHNFRSKERCNKAISLLQLWFRGEGYNVYIGIVK